MSTALSLLKLILVVSVSIAYLVGLGWLVVGPLLHRHWFKRRSPTLLVQEFPLALLAGFILNFGILLIVQSLKISLFIGGVLSLAGLVMFTIYLFRYHLGKVEHPDATEKWIAIAFLCLLFVGPVLTLPLYDWDARSIWFFHSKMIYTAGTIGLPAGWQDPAASFSHPDYPKMLPSLSSQVMYVVGFWNEYLPKISLYLAFIPAFFWLVSFARKSISFLFLIIIMPFSLFPWLWNGYMDGMLALYFCMSLLLFDRFLKTNDRTDLFASVASLVFMLYIKNEGTLAALALVIGYGLLYILRRKPVISLKQIKPHWQPLLILFICLIPFIVWWIYKEQWGLTNDLGVGTGSSIERLIPRLSDGSLTLVFEKIFKYINGSLMLLAVFLISNLAFKRPFVWGSLPAMTAVLLYVLGTAVIYLITPHNLVWHLNNSTVRVMELANGGISIACYLFMDALEHDPAVNAHQRIQ